MPTFNLFFYFVLLSTYFYCDAQPWSPEKVKTIKFSSYLENATIIPPEYSDVVSDLYVNDGELLGRQIDSQGSDNNSAIIESKDEKTPDKTK